MVFQPVLIGFPRFAALSRAIYGAVEMRNFREGVLTSLKTA